MKNSILKLSQCLIAILVIGVTSCSDDDTTAEKSTMDLLVGTWTTSSVDIDATVEGQSLTDYLVNEVGLSENEAADQYALFEAALVSEVTGSLTLNADNTYESSFAGNSDSGTWSLSSDENTLTLLEGTDAIVVTINSLTANTLSGSLGDDIMQDLDDDPGTPDETITVVATIILTK
ncbi:MAG TPA: lipocalin family protein [Eudoraea sp.]|nr:lipocalin family protein [Eudoraea sp.]